MTTERVNLKVIEKNSSGEILSETTISPIAGSVLHDFWTIVSKKLTKMILEHEGGATLTYERIANA